MPSISLGVLYRGEVIHYGNYGYCDIQAKTKPNENTNYVICSLTKAFTAAMAGILVDKKKLDWTTPLHQVLPEYNRADVADVTIEDLLSHRSGLAGLDGIWLMSDGFVGVTRADAIMILNTAPVVSAIRQGFLYNNIAYEAVGQVIEKVSGVRFEKFLREQILTPLAMKDTYYTAAPSESHEQNTAKPYSTLLNGTHVEIPPPLHGQDVAMGAAGGIRSSVHDLLKMYKAFLEAANHSDYRDPEQAERTTDRINPLKQLDSLFRSKVAILRAPVPQPSKQAYPAVTQSSGHLDRAYFEHNYALGWGRVDLPHTLGLPGTEDAQPFIVAKNSRQVLLYHQGQMPGYLAFTGLLPEQCSAVVVLGNSSSLGEPTKVIGSLLLETILEDSDPDTEAFVEVATGNAEREKALLSNTFANIKNGKTVAAPVRAVEAYQGKYWHPFAQFFIDIKVADGKLLVAFMGKEEDTFELEAYQQDSFFWQMAYDEYVKLGRLPFHPDYYILKFGCAQAGHTSIQDNPEADIQCLWWRYDEYLPEDREVFRKE